LAEKEGYRKFQENSTEIRRGNMVGKDFKQTEKNCGVGHLNWRKKLVCKIVTKGLQLDRKKRKTTEGRLDVKKKI